MGAPCGSGRSKFSGSSGLHGLQTFVTRLPGKCSCGEVRNFQVARKKNQRSRGMERMNKREKEFYGVVGRPFMQGFSFGSQAVGILCLLYWIKYITPFPPLKLIRVHASLD